MPPMKKSKSWPRQVVDRYSLRALDFDIEGDALANTAANERRAAAIKKLQVANSSLQIWVTLPVDPNGLPEHALSVVEGMLQAGVKLAGVNVMTMNYGGSRPAGVAMDRATEDALNATFQQLDAAYRTAGISLTDAELWPRLGATPMIGQNDVESDVFALSDAASLLEFSRVRGMGRLSLWSANRDVRCGAAVTDRQRRRPGSASVRRALRQCDERKARWFRSYPKECYSAGQH